MKLCFFDDFKLGVIKDNCVVDVTPLVNKIPHSSPGTLMSGLIGRFAEFRPRLEAEASRCSGLELNRVRLRAPLPAPNTTVCMAVNYMENGKIGRAHV